MKISDYISTVEKIRPDDTLRNRICSIRNIAVVEPIVPSQRKKRASSHLLWVIPAAAILMVLFGGALIARVLMPAATGNLPGSTSPSDSFATGSETTILTPVVHAFSISVYAADGTMAPVTKEAVSLVSYQNDTLPGIPFTMDSSIYTDSIITVEADKGAIVYAPASDKDFVTYSAGTICTIKAGDTFYWSPDSTDSSAAAITITEKRSDVFCSYIRMSLSSDPGGEYSAKIETVLSAPIESSGTLSVSGKIQDGVYLNAAIDPVSAGYYFNPDAVGKRYITHLEPWNDGKFVSAFSEELEGAAIRTQQEQDAVLHFVEVKGTDNATGKPITFWVNDITELGNENRTAYYKYRYDNGVDILIKGNFSHQASFSTKTERTAESATGYPMYYLPTLDDLTQEEKDSLQQELPFASRAQALAAVMQKLDKLGISVSPDFWCYAVSSEQFPDNADCYYFGFRQELNGLPVYRNDWVKEQQDKEYTLAKGSGGHDVCVEYSEDGIIDFRISHIYLAENSSGCEISECTIPDIISAYDKFVELNGNYTVTEVKLAYVETSYAFTETDYVVTLEPCWAFKVRNNDTGEEIDYSEYGESTEWYYVPYSLAG